MTTLLVCQGERRIISRQSCEEVSEITPQIVEKYGAKPMGTSISSFDGNLTLKEEVTWVTD